MGVVFYVACKDCKVIRCLDKFRTMHINPTNTEEMLTACENLENSDTYRATLLATFMAKHQYHNCTCFNDTLLPDDIHDYEDDDGWWK